MSNKEKNSDFSLFFKANLLLTSLIYLLFLQYNEDYQALDFFLVLLGSLSTASLVVALVYLLLVLFKFTGKFVLYFSAVIFTLINISLLVDFFIFKLFKFHINGMIINLFTSPDALDSIQAGLTPVIAFIVVILALFFFEIFLIKKLSRTDNPIKTRLNNRLNKLVLIPLFIIFTGEKVAYGFATLTSNHAIISKFKVIPLYQPLTFNRVAAKYFDYKPKVEAQNTLKQNANLNYPLNPIEIPQHPKSFNIFIFAADSVKSSIVGQQTTPNLMAFKQGAITLNNHHTGGNSTRFGIFSLMYGLNASYWFPILDANKGSVLFDALKDLDYQINIASSTSTNWPEFKNTCYVQIQDTIKDAFDGVPWEKDQQASAYFSDWLAQQNQNNPMFSFVFLDAPHGYSFPEDVNPYKASLETANYLTLEANSKEMEAVEKQYKSAVYYDDKLFGEMLTTLKQKGLYDDALIIYTSDHGQEFFEFGSFGHNTNFSSAQTQVPMVIKLPDFLKSQIKLPSSISHNSYEGLTSHVDIVPSILSLIGLKNQTADYSNGKNIFDKNFNRNQVISSNWTKNAIIGNDQIYVFSNTPDKIFSSEIRDSKSYKLLNNSAIKSKRVLTVINQNRQFLK